jgi:16S rRNA (adenine1518-N6/adenine1519-N6)-dimethyltransferase
MKIDKKLFFKIVKAAFSQPRKQILNNLSKVLKLDKLSNILNNKNLAGKEKTREWLLKSGVDPSQRAETLAIKDWLKLTKDWYKI